MFQNEELSNILKDIFGDEEEVDAREQEEDDMCDDEGEMKERMAMQMLEDSVCGMNTVCFQYAKCTSSCKSELSFSCENHIKCLFCKQDEFQIIIMFQQLRYYC